jgi:hypothetical protein
MAESVSETLGKAKAAAQGPLRTIRGAGEQEKMLHNARVEYEDEAHEIATRSGCRSSSPTCCRT